MTGNWITPIGIEITEGMKTVYDLLDEYKDFLDANHPEHSNSFDQRCNNQPESARAEAVAYSFFKSHGYDVQVEETPGKGGVDFRVQAESTNFVVEVTSMLRKNYTKYSGMPEMILAGVRSASPYKVPPRIRRKASGKVSQMSGYNCSRILMIACEHPEHHYYLNKRNPLGPQALLTGPPKLSVLGGKNVSCLKDSLFLEFENDRIAFCREEISAVLLFYISKYHAQTIGLLHPQPMYKFSVDLLPSVPFVEVLISGIGATEGHAEPRWIPDNLPDGLFVYNQWH